jgi:hypothetical protein
VTGRPCFLGQQSSNSDYCGEVHEMRMLPFLICLMSLAPAFADPMNPDVLWFSQVPGSTAISYDSGHTSFTFTGGRRNASRLIQDHFHRLGWKMHKDNDTSSDAKEVFVASRDSRQITIAIERQGNQVFVNFDTGGSTPGR